MHARMLIETEPDKWKQQDFLIRCFNSVKNIEKNIKIKEKQVLIC